MRYFVNLQETNYKSVIEKIPNLHEVGRQRRGILDYF